jgi:hypothetical protein
VSIRRLTFSRPLELTTPVAVTRHGQTVGYFIPTQGQVEADLAALKKASKTPDKLLATQGVDVESVVADFKEGDRPSKNINAAIGYWNDWKRKNAK